jgi:hypothetical protein
VSCTQPPADKTGRPVERKLGREDRRMGPRRSAHCGGVGEALQAICRFHASAISIRQPVATRGKCFGLFRAILAASDLRLIATGCNHGSIKAPSLVVELDNADRRLVDVSPPAKVSATARTRTSTTVTCAE